MYVQYTTVRHELLHTRKAWPGTLVYHCLLSGFVKIVGNAKGIIRGTGDADNGNT
jgi:hypothetical protein